VAKVREVIGQVDLVRVPMTHQAVVGVFKLRDNVIPLVDLQLYFEPGRPSEAQQRSVILMEFNDFQIGFLVDGVERIYRMSWKEVKPMPMGQGDKDSVITSVCEVDQYLALMVDFEKITFDINGDQNIFNRGGMVPESGAKTRKDHRIILAEDSPTIRHAIRSNLIESGYVQVTACSDGGEAWNQIEQTANDPSLPRFSIVVTDIEMPRMDGLHLCKRIKENPSLRETPVIVFSSLVSDTNLKKCESVGADAAITKPQMVRLVEILDDILKTKITLEEAVLPTELAVEAVETEPVGAV
jgi:two-component system chemotaxis response regulator CheV